MVSLFSLSYRVIVFSFFLILALYSGKIYKKAPQEFKPLFRNSTLLFLLATIIRGIDIAVLYFPIPFYHQIHSIGHIVVMAGLLWVYIAFSGQLVNFFFPPEPKVEKVGAYLATSHFEIEGILKTAKSILAITREPKRYQEYNSRVIWITSAEGQGVPPTALHVITDLAIRFAKENIGGTVVLDCVEFLILYNGFKATYKFLVNLKDHLLTRGATLIVVLNPNAVDEREFTLIKREFPQIEEASVF
ncbi:DUF835 domain-containing protein [Pyrococcus sp. ST04]|uniref:DUF835 domain-containing protein n=1 Tax=Pyrococcus sp. ST04 TaxID=1183377 RepID=UPI00026059F3|nr:DUF835 domain-containing protein [Pyrococcus sp. ST04]AFK21924.1 hypothetical protein Py04_0322 [Pyrococcus sp. ST04]